MKEKEHQSIEWKESWQDEVHGPLVEQVDKTVDLVYTKYMKARIDYESYSENRAIYVP